MDLFLFAIGIIGIPLCLILLIVNAIRKKPKKKAAIGIVVCFILLISGATMTPTEPGKSVDVPENSVAEVNNTVLEMRELTDDEKELLKKNYADFTEVEKEVYDKLSYNYAKYNNEYSDETKAEWRDEFVRLQAEALDDFEEKKELIKEPVVVQAPKVSETLGQKNAVGKAKQYLSLMAFSKIGLVEQLEYEGFSNEEATYAVNNVNVDWKEQAVSKGKEYLDLMSYSRSGLIEQLEYEGFSSEEATYAVDQIGF